MRAIEADPTLEVIVDVADLRVSCPAIDLDEPFTMTEHTQHRLLNGLDDVGLTLQHTDVIGTFEEHRNPLKPNTQRAFDDTVKTP